MDWAAVSAISGASVAFLAILAFIVHQLRPKARAVRQFWEHLVGVEENTVTGQARIPGLFEEIRELKTGNERLEGRMDSQDGVLETIRHEVEFNNGSSVKDATLRLESGQEDQAKKLDDIATRLDAHLKPVATTTINVHPQESA